MGIENIQSVHLVSSKNRRGLHSLQESVEDIRNGRDICVIGAANAGKSSFLNAFLSIMKQHRSRDKRAQMKLMMNANAEEMDAEKEEYNNIGKEEPREIHGTMEELDAILAIQDEIQQEENAVPKKVVSSTSTVSPFPGTTLSTIPIALPTGPKNEIANIWDTPGLILNKKRQKLMEILSQDGTKGLASAIPTKTIKVRTATI